MSYEQKPNSGTMGRVPDEKRTSEKFPEFDGKLSTTCPHCGATQGWWLSAWVKEGKLGKFFSLAVKPMQVRQEPEAPRSRMDEKVPF